MIMNSAAYGWGRTECAVTTGGSCFDFMLARVHKHYTVEDEGCECDEIGMRCRYADLFIDCASVASYWSCEVGADLPQASKHQQ